MKSFRDIKSSVPRRNPSLSKIGINLGFGSINAKPMQKKEPTFKLHARQTGRKEAQEKIPIETLKSWVIDELSFLKEEKGKIDFCNGKAKLLLDFLPEIFRDEILKLFGG